jgi:hypothetical protein
MVAMGYDKGGGGGGLKPDASWPELLFLAVYQFLGATGTSALAGLCVLACLVWLYFRVRTPPVMYTLTRRPARRR